MGPDERPRLERSGITKASPRNERNALSCGRIGRVPRTSEGAAEWVVAVPFKNHRGVVIKPVVWLCLGVLGGHRNERSVASLRRTRGTGGRVLVSWSLSRFTDAQGSFDFTLVLVK